MAMNSISAVLSCCVLFLFLRLAYFLQTCDETSQNSRGFSIISTPNVFTALQCEDKCFRNALCNGYNFKQRDPSTSIQYAVCELVKLNASKPMSHSPGYSFRKLNREAIKEKWLGKSCGSCNSRQECSRQIGSCSKYPCKCKNGYLDDGNGTCPFVACTNNSFLVKDEGNITVPTFIEKKCHSGSTVLMSDYTCYYQMSFSKTRNLTLTLHEIQLGSGNSHSGCSTASQYMDIIVDNGSHQKYCGNNFNVSKQLTGKNIYLKFFFKEYSNPCITVMANYKVKPA